MTQPSLPPNKDIPSNLPENLPPVEPPSAKIIAQLFLVPGVIVMMIACAWLVLTRLASSDQDWRALVRGVETRNEHERWRSAFGLAQLLQSDASAPLAEQHLVNNSELAQTLSRLFAEEIKQPGKNEEDSQKRVFLATTLGLFKTPEVVLPALRAGMASDQDREVRNAALRSISTVLGHGFLSGKPLEDRETLEAVLAASAEVDPLVRSMATYTLGLFPLSGTQSRLEILLTDPDENVRANAALALVRHKSLAPLPQLKKMLAAERSPVTPPAHPIQTSPSSQHSASNPLSQSTSDDPQGERFSHHLQVTNALTGIGKLLEVLPTNEKQELQTLVEKLANSDPDPSIRVQAQSLLVSFRGK